MFGIFLASLLFATAPTFNEGNDRGVFVYGYLVADFRVGVEVAGMRFPLQNCSSDTRYCSKGHLFNVVVPRFCRDLDPRIGTVWREGDLETTVIAQSNRPTDIGPAGATRTANSTVYYLQTNRRPDVVFAYSGERGVFLIYYDVRHESAPREAVDFPALARNGQLDHFTQQAIGDAGREHMVLPLLTLDRFASCLPEEFRARH